MERLDKEDTNLNIIVDTQKFEPILPCLKDRELEFAQSC